MSLAYVSGEWVPLSEARVPVLDRAFLLADGVYEVIPVYAGRALRLEPHLARLARSLRELRIDDPHSLEVWRALCERLIRENGAGDLLLYLQVTRGAPARRSHLFPADTPATVVGFCQELPLPGEAARRQGVSAITAPDIRWQRCDIKAIALLPNLLATQAAAEKDCNEAILYRGDVVTEGASSNVFAVIGGQVVTPPEGPTILSGVTRALVLELLASAGIPFEERALHLAELRQAEEIWITSSTREVLPVTTLDGQPVGGGSPGPLGRRAQSLYEDYKRQALAP